MKWFKHYSNTLDSDSIMDIKRKFGFAGLGRYWVLIEFLYSKWPDSKSPPVFDIQRETLRDLFGIRSWNGLQTFADHLATIPGIEVERFENVYRIKADILLKLLHSDFKKSGTKRERIPPKKESKSKKESITLKSNTKAAAASTKYNWLMKMWNETVTDLSPIQKIQGTRLKTLEARVNEYADRQGTMFWQNWMNAVQNSDFLTGRKTDWKANFDWCIKAANFLKILEGNYTNNSPQKKIAGMQRSNRELTDQEILGDFYIPSESEQSEAKQ